MSTSTSSHKRWRVAIVGLGHWYSAFNLARAVREYPRAEIVGAAWHDQAQLEMFCRTFGVEGFSDCEALIERDDVDIVQIAAPVAEIPELTIRAARAGKHIIMGKPMAMTIAEADRMGEADGAVVDRGGLVSVGQAGMVRGSGARAGRRVHR